MDDWSDLVAPAAPSASPEGWADLVAPAGTPARDPSPQAQLAANRRGAAPRIANPFGGVGPEAADAPDLRTLPHGNDAPSQQDAPEDWSDLVQPAAASSQMQGNGVDEYGRPYPGGSVGPAKPLPGMPTQAGGAYQSGIAVRTERGREAPYDSLGTVVPGQGSWTGAPLNNAAQSLVGGIGGAIGGVGDIAAGAQKIAAAEQQLAIMRRIDAGDSVPVSDYPAGYGSMSAADRATVKKSYETMIAQYRAAPVTPNALQQAGGALQRGAEAEFPVDKEKAKEFLTKLTGFIGGAAPLVATTMATGPAGAALIGGAQSYHNAYQTARGKGVSEEQAHAAALPSGLAGAGLMSFNMGVIVSKLPAAVQQSVVGAAGHYLASSGTMMIAAQLQRVVDNASAQATYDPKRSLWEGVGHGEDLALDAVTGGLLHGAFHAPGQVRQGLNELRRPDAAPELRQGVAGVQENAETIQDARRAAPEPAPAASAEPAPAEASTPAPAEASQESTPPADGDSHTRADRRALTDLGYTADDIATMTPELGRSIIAEKRGEPARSLAGEPASDSSAAPRDSRDASDDPAPRSDAPLTGRNFGERAGGWVSRLMADLGLTKNQAAGVVGNLGHESGLEAINERNPTVAGSRGGFGAAQWTGVRRVAFEAYAKERGLAVTDMEANYGFLLHELQGTHKGALEALRGTESVDAATEVFEARYEGANIKAMGSRLKFARQAAGAEVGPGDGTAPRTRRGAAGETETAAAGPAYDPVGEDMVQRVFAGGVGVDTRPRVVELADLIASHGADGQVNPAYPHAEGLQPRDRTAKGSQDQVRDIAAKLNPELLKPTADASVGAPIVGPDGRVVENGNGRVAALSLVYGDPGLSGQRDAYRSFLTQQGYDTSGMQQPVLVSQRLTSLEPPELKKFIAGTADRSTLARSPGEQARADAGHAGDAIHLWTGSDAGSVGNAGFVRSFMQGLTPNERGDLQTANGTLNSKGAARVQSAVFAHAFGDELGPTLDRLQNSDNDGMKTIAGAMTDAAGPWAQMRSEAARGHIPAGLDMTPDLAHAVQIVAHARDTGRPIAELLNQADLDRPVSPLTHDFVHSFFRDAEMKVPAGRDKVADRLREYAREAMTVPAGRDMFGTEPPGAAEVMSRASKRLSAREAEKRAMQSRRDGAAAEAAGRRDPDAADIPPEAAAARERLRVGMQAMMRFNGLPPEVGLRLAGTLVSGANESARIRLAFERRGISPENGALLSQMIIDKNLGAADTLLRRLGVPEAKVAGLLRGMVRATGEGDASYVHKLIEVAIDRRMDPAKLAQKVQHEIMHGLLDERLGLLTPGQTDTLLRAADDWLTRKPPPLLDAQGNPRLDAQGKPLPSPYKTNRAELEKRYGSRDPALIREEAVARMGEEALTAGIMTQRPSARVYGRVLNAVRGIGQVLRGENYRTAEDVFRGLLRGDKALAGSREALAAAGPLDPTRRIMAAAGVPMPVGFDGQQDQQRPEGSDATAAAPNAAPSGDTPTPSPTPAPPAKTGNATVDALAKYGTSPERYMSLRAPETLEFERLSDPLRPMGSPLVAQRDMIAARDKSEADALRRNAKAVADFFERRTGRPHGESSRDVPAPVVEMVLAMTDNQQVLRAIVGALPVDVVDLLRRQKIAPERLLRDEAMLQKGLSGKHEGPVALRGRMADALVRAVTGVAAKDPGFVSLLGRTGERKAASAADDGNVPMSLLSRHNSNIAETKGVGNRGSFDPKDPRINYSLRDETPPMVDLTPQEMLGRAGTLRTIYNETLGNNPRGRVALLGKITPEGAAIINAALRKAGFDADVSGYQHTADDYAARHTFKKHGDEKTEASRGQSAITADDWARIPDILSSPDQVEVVGTTRLGRPLLRYTKTDGGRTFYAEEVLTKRQRLAAVTMWKGRPGEPGRSDAARGDPQSSTPDSALPSQPKPSQTADGNIAPPDGDAKFSRRDPEQTRANPLDFAGLPHLYSAVGRAAKGLKQAKGSGEQMLAAIQNTPGVKPEEMKYLGLADWLRGQKSVTREQVADYVRANALDIQETRLGDTDAGPHGADLYDAARDGGASHEDAMAAVDRNAASNAVSGDPKFKDYTLSGGENYQEVLLTLPEKQRSDLVLDLASHYLGGVPLREIDSPEMLATASKYNSSFARAVKGKSWPEVQQAIGEAITHATTKSYQSSHWDEQNVVAHARTDERTAPDGKRVLMVHEAQSDWHQSGRKYGYLGEKPTGPGNFFDWGARRGMSREAMDQAWGTANARENNPIVQEWAHEGDVAQAAHDRYQRAVPEAPFKTSWPMLVMKRMIGVAVSRGMDRLAWSPGDVHADRYSLSRTIKDLTLRGTGDDLKLSATDHNDNTVIDRKPTTRAGLADLIGKETAEKLLSQEEPDPSNPHSSRYIFGADLKVGGEGMRGFYDKILPTEVQKLIGKYGSKVERTEIEGDGTPHSVHSFDITPALRKTVTEGGLPLYAKRDPRNDDMFARAPARAATERAPLLSDKAGLERAGQGALDGMGASDRQAIAAREATGLRSGQKDTSDLPLFERKMKEQPRLFAIRAFHGTPHDFERFDISKMGTGEGAQAYGAGHYFAQSESTARYYRDTLAKWTNNIDSHVKRLTGLALPDEHLRTVQRIAMDDALSSTEAAKRLTYQIPELRKVDGPTLNAPKPTLDALVQAIRNDKTKGSMYEVNLHAEPHELLDWDKPLSEQPLADKLAQITPEQAGLTEQRSRHKPNAPVEYVNSDDRVFARSDKPVKNLAELLGDMTGREVYDKFRSFGDGMPADASKKLAEMGVPGIRYLDGMSRADGEGSHNFVLFHDNGVEIIRKYSLRQNLDDALTFAKTAGRIGVAPLAKLTATPRRWVNEALNEALFPMRAGSGRAQSAAFDFANALRNVQFRYSRIDQALVKQFTTPERFAMGAALDAQSVHEQQMRALPEAQRPAARAAFEAGKTGLASLTEPQRAVVMKLNELAQETWKRLVERGIVMPGAEGVPYYMPRTFVKMDALTGARRITREDNRFKDEPKPTKPGEGVQPGGDQGGGGLTAMDQIGANLKTGGVKAREHLTPEDSLANLKSKVGDDAVAVTDIRALIDAIQRQERSIVGKDLVNAIKKAGTDAGMDLVREGMKPERDFFTLDHPSLWTVGPTGAVDKEGKPLYGRTPLHIAAEYEGPLRAVLTAPAPRLYKGLMAINNTSLGMLMFSPYMHLGVEVGRSGPIYNLNFREMGRSMSRAEGLIEDRAFTDQMVKDGVAPIGRGWANYDPVSVMNEAVKFREPGWISKIIGGDTVVQRKHHDFHQSQLWDRVFRLQVGIYNDMRSRFIEKKGFAPEAAGIMAGHLANRYAGALPPEHLSRFTNMTARLMMFSRSFTLGNLGAMKDALNGAPSHIRAKLVELVGESEAKRAINTLQRKAIGAFVMDIGFSLGVIALAQAGFGVVAKMINGNAFPAAAQQEWDDYVAGMQDGVLPQWQNEPGRDNRAYIGQDNKGRGTYGRVSAGKLGEEMTGWLPFVGHPGTMLLNKASPMLRATWEAVQNKDSMSRDIYNPHPAGMLEHIGVARDIAFHYVKAMTPYDFVENAYNVAHSAVTGQSAGDPLVAFARFAGPLTGALSISQGNAKGPQAGVEQAYMDRQKYTTNKAYPEAKRLYAMGKEDEARAVLEKAYGTDARGANKAMLSIITPERARIRLDRNFQRTADDATKDRAARVTGGTRPSNGIGDAVP